MITIKIYCSIPVGMNLVLRVIGVLFLNSPTVHGQTKPPYKPDLSFEATFNTACRFYYKD